MQSSECYRQGIVVLIKVVKEGTEGVICAGQSEFRRGRKTYEPNICSEPGV